MHVYAVGSGPVGFPRWPYSPICIGIIAAAADCWNFDFDHDGICSCKTYLGGSSTLIRFR